MNIRSSRLSSDPSLGIRMRRKYVHGSPIQSVSMFDGLLLFHAVAPRPLIFSKRLFRRWMYKFENTFQG